MQRRASQVPPSLGTTVRGPMLITPPQQALSNSMSILWSSRLSPLKIMMHIKTLKSDVLSTPQPAVSSGSETSALLETLACVWRSDNSFEESILFSHLAGSRGVTYHQAWQQVLSHRVNSATQFHYVHISINLINRCINYYASYFDKIVVYVPFYQ